jgi:hypothetical protein
MILSPLQSSICLPALQKCTLTVFHRFIEMPQSATLYAPVKLRQFIFDINGIDDNT